MEGLVRLILLILVLFSCNPKPTPPKPIPIPPPQETPGIRFYIKSATGFTVEDTARLQRIAARVQEIINTPEFKQDVIGYINPVTKKNEYWGDKKVWHQSPSVVLSNVMKGDIGITLIAYCKDGTTVGYTYPSVEWVRVNRCHSNFKKDNLVAQNQFHEALHKLGYIHAQEWDKLRDTSVPYALGTMIRRRY